MEGEREGEKHHVWEVRWSVAFHAPNWGPGLQPRHAPLPGIEPVTSQFTRQCSIHWATPARSREGFKLFENCFKTHLVPWNDLDTSALFYIPRALVYSLPMHLSVKIFSKINEGDFRSFQAGDDCYQFVVSSPGPPRPAVLTHPRERSGYTIPLCSPTLPTIHLLTNYMFKST